MCDKYVQHTLLEQISVTGRPQVEEALGSTRRFTNAGLFLLAIITVICKLHDVAVFTAAPSYVPFD